MQIGKMGVYMYVGNTSSNGALSTNTPKQDENFTIFMVNTENNYVIKINFNTYTFTGYNKINILKVK